ncbi:hypothetical protein [Mucilaginibacter sp. CSA2-8R]
MVTGITGGQEEEGYFTANSSRISHMGRTERNVWVLNRDSIFLNFDQR